MLAHPTSLPRCYGPLMIDLGALAGLHERQHELHAYCSTCDRWSVLDLGRMVRDGHGDCRLPIKVGCQICGKPGQLQVRAPMPTWTNSRGWMEPRQDML